MKKYEKTIKKLKKDKEILKNIIKVAKEETDVTLIELAKIFGVSESLIENYAKRWMEKRTVPISTRKAFL